MTVKIHQIITTKVTIISPHDYEDMRRIGTLRAFIAECDAQGVSDDQEYTEGEDSGYAWLEVTAERHETVDHCDIVEPKSAAIIEHSLMQKLKLAYELLSAERASYAAQLTALQDAFNRMAQQRDAARAEVKQLASRQPSTHCG